MLPSMKNVLWLAVVTVEMNYWCSKVYDVGEWTDMFCLVVSGFC